MPATRKRRGRNPVWADWSDAKLLAMRICDLGVAIEGTWLEDRLEALYADLDRRGFVFRPHVWLSNEWFTPDGIPGFAMPFYLAHPRLMQLERSQMLEIEGGTREECLKIMRHECGHAIQNAYRLHWRRVWQHEFGKASQKYPKYYRPNPASRHYVQHLRLYYAQSHPTEDFAETFAIWLQATPASWRKRYDGWPALRKLEMVDDLMEELVAKRPLVKSHARIEPAGSLKTTLHELYEGRREQYLRSFPSIYDRDLRKLFSDEEGCRGELAATFLRRNRQEIRKLVSRWTGEYEYTLEEVMQDIIGRAKELRLRAVGPPSRLRIEFAILLTANTLHFHYSRRNWFAL